MQTLLTEIPDMNDSWLSTTDGLKLPFEVLTIFGGSREGSCFRSLRFAESSAHRGSFISHYSSDAGWQYASKP